MSAPEEGGGQVCPCALGECTRRRDKCFLGGSQREEGATGRQGATTFGGRETRAGAAQKEAFRKGKQQGPHARAVGSGCPQDPNKQQQHHRKEVQHNGASNTTKPQGNQPPVKGAAGLRRKATPKGSQAGTGSQNRLKRQTDRGGYREPPELAERTKKQGGFSRTCSHM